VRHLAAQTQPLEYEAQVKYPGAPVSLDAPGGRTVRRLLQACARDELYRDWATSPELAERLRQLLGGKLELSQAHHNCIMTKNPAFSSATGWHQDIRYWSFQNRSGDCRCRTTIQWIQHRTGFGWLVRSHVDW